MKYKTLFITLLLFSNAGAIEPEAIRSAVEQHRRPALAFFREFLSLPNVASEPADIERLLEWLEPAFEARGFAVRRLPTGGSDVLYAERIVPESPTTLLVYLQADGQPVDPSAWDQPDPFVPVLKAPDGEGAYRELPWSAAETAYQSDWRVFARSASDSKGPMAQFLLAVELLDAEGFRPDSAARTTLAASGPDSPTPATAAETVFYWFALLFAFVFLVMLPAKLAAQAGGMTAEQAAVVAWHAGLVAVPVNARLHRDEIAFIEFSVSSFRTVFDSSPSPSVRSTSIPGKSESATSASRSASKTSTARPMPSRMSARRSLMATSSPVTDGIEISSARRSVIRSMTRGYRGLRSFDGRTDSHRQHLGLLRRPPVRRT